MRVLIIKTSSMGDVIHTLPAITDAVNAKPTLSFDWVVEEAFAEIPRWHPAVQHVIPVAIRRWRKQWRTKNTWLEWRAFHQQLKSTAYDVVIDAQGLLKSALLARLAHGQRVGFDRQSAREPFAALFYQQRFSIEKNQHAITRLRQLFSHVFDYSLPETVPAYGIDRNLWREEKKEPYLVFLHGTTWATKHWPERYWIALAKQAVEHAFHVKLMWGNEEEKARAERIAAAVAHVAVLPRLALSGIAQVLANAEGVVGVDTGLSHLAAAFNIPAVSLYGPTRPQLTGALGKNQVHLSASLACSPCLQRRCTYRPLNPSNPSPLEPPCFETLPPSLVWAALSTELKRAFSGK